MRDVRVVRGRNGERRGEDGARAERGDGARETVRDNRGYHRYGEDGGGVGEGIVRERGGGGGGHRVDG